MGGKSVWNGGHPDGNFLSKMLLMFPSSGLAKETAGAVAQLASPGCSFQTAPVFCCGVVMAVIMKLLLLLCIHDVMQV